MMKALETGNMGDLPDPKLGNNFSENEMQRMIMVASACIGRIPHKRPRMRMVILVLENHVAKIDTQNETIYGQGFYSQTSGYSELNEIFQKMLRGEDIEVIGSSGSKCRY